jgi:hypothetical protein
VSSKWDPLSHSVSSGLFIADFLLSLSVIMMLGLRVVALGQVRSDQGGVGGFTMAHA